MKPIGVLVGNRPRLMRELVMAAIADQPDIVVKFTPAGKSRRTDGYPIRAWQRRL
ncbi:MAG: hypothetical protein LAN59_00980 [Acidobacteriia bacterium]|nr:hypothetical protein [Terriglobia bacterium]